MNPLMVLCLCMGLVSSEASNGEKAPWNLNKTQKAQILDLFTAKEKSVTADGVVTLVYSFDSDRSEDTRLNSSHITISYAVFCLKKKKKKI